MNIIDIAIILIIACYIVIGAKRGFSKEIVSFLGFYVMVIVAFVFRTPLATLMYEHLPFIPFGGIFKGLAVLNIILYEILAFVILLSILLVVLHFLIFATSIFEKMLNATIILGIPSKILGGIIGIVEGFVWSFILVYVLSLPVFQLKAVNESKLSSILLQHTPVLSEKTKSFHTAIEQFDEVKKDYEGTNDIDTFNYQALEVLLKNKIITSDSVSKLKQRGRLTFKGIDTLITKYKEE